MKPAILVLAVVFFWAIDVSAQVSQCQYDSQCASHLVCMAGECTQPSVDNRNAEDTCGNDRRCRIDRLKRRNNARRKAEVLSEERQVQQMVDAQQAERERDNPRVAAPATLDWRISRLGALGFAGGWTFAGQLRAEGEFVFNESDIYFSTSNFFGGIDGFQETTFVSARAVYFILDSWFSPYVSAGVKVGWGDFNAYDGFGSQLESTYHAVEAGLGFDVQFEFGMHSRLGVDFRPLIYSQASSEPGVYNEIAKDGLEDWWADDALIDVVWMIGWAF